MERRRVTADVDIMTIKHRCAMGAYSTLTMTMMMMMTMTG